MGVEPLEMRDQEVRQREPERGEQADDPHELVVHRVDADGSGGRGWRDRAVSIFATGALVLAQLLWIALLVWFVLTLVR